ncbi:MAG: hypothetical protein ACKN9U_21935, partial [Pirellulaceae bacterium]
CLPGVVAADAPPHQQLGNLRCRSLWVLSILGLQWRSREYKPKDDHQYQDPVGHGKFRRGGAAEWS